MPAEGLVWLPKPEILTFEEITRLVGVFTSLGVRSLKLTGGEPTVRTDLPVLVKMLRERNPDVDMSLTTNGLLLDKMSTKLAGAGLDRVTVSCDSLLRHRFAEMTRRDALERVLAGLDAAEAAGLTPIKLNVVIIGGTNDDEVVEFAKLARRKNYEVRFIEYMPLDAEHAWERAKVVPSAKLLEKINAEHPLTPDHGPEPATTYRLRRRRAGQGRRHPERHRAVLRHLQPAAADGRRPVPLLSVLARRDRPPRAAPRGRVRRGPGEAHPGRSVDEVVGPPHQPPGLRPARTQHVDDRRLRPAAHRQPTAYSCARRRSPLTFFST